MAEWTKFDMPGPDNGAHGSQSDYIYGIDLVRFASATGVAAFHLNESAITRALTVPFGWIGVEVFFVISGLVIANSARGASQRQFVVHRFLRLYPAAWCAAIVNLPLFLWYFGKHSRWFLSLSQSILLVHFPRGNFLAGAYWTLPVEFSFYFLVFVMIRVKRFERIQWLAIFLILWSAPYSLALVLNCWGVVHWPWVDIGFGLPNMLLFRHGLYFGLGILVWLFKEKQIERVGVLAGGLALVLGIMEIYGRTVEYFPDFARGGYAPHAFWHNLANWAVFAFYSGFAAILISVRFNHLFPANAAVRRIVRSLGLMTYPFYLMHERVGGYVTNQMSRVGLDPLLCALASFICLGTISLFIASYCEPALRGFLRRNFGVLNPAMQQEASPVP